MHLLPTPMPHPLYFELELRISILASRFQRKVVLAYKLMMITQFATKDEYALLYLTGPTLV